jgi:hypothetical protein
MGTVETGPLQFRLIYVDRIKAYISTEKRYTVTLKKDS